MARYLVCFFIIFLLVDALNLQGQCEYQMQTFSIDSSCGESCAWEYQGAYGNLRVPVKYFFLGQSLAVQISQVDEVLAAANDHLQNEGFSVEFYRVGGYVYNTEQYNIFCKSLSQNCPCDPDFAEFEALFPIMENNANTLNLFIVDSLVTVHMNAQLNCDTNIAFGYSFAESTMPAHQSGVIIWDSVFYNSEIGTLAHELGHTYGLLHTFDTTFGNYNCEFGGDDYCFRDGIADTPCDPSADPVTLTSNLMDYPDFNAGYCPIDTLSDCQIAKMYKMLFDCRSILCVAPDTPEVLVGGFLSSNLIYNRGENLDVLEAILDSSSGTNTGNFALFTVRRADGTIALDTFANIFDLNYLIDEEILPSFGSFTVEVRDMAMYNHSCISEPYIVSITIHPCNSDEICDPMENYSNCADCYNINGPAIAQINYIEYFFDIDPGYGGGNSIPISSNTDVLVDEGLEISGLSPGAHVLYVRSRDTNLRWSYTSRKLFYTDAAYEVTNSVLTELEYFIDTDPGFGNGESLALENDTNSITSFDLAVSSQSTGVHVLYIRGRDSSGDWSYATRKVFYIQPTQEIDQTILTDLEYFIDIDPGFGNGESLLLENDTNSILSFDLPTSSQSPGVHVLYIRGRDSAENWSYITRKIFYIRTTPEVDQRVLTELEYFIDADPGFGSGIPLTLENDTYSLNSYPLLLDTLVQGEHKLYVRAKDNSGGWGFTCVKPFSIYVVGPIVFVDWNATGVNTGTSWTNAFRNLQSALAIAAEYDTVQQIWVADGLYKPSSSADRSVSFEMRGELGVYGGFLGVENLLEERTENPSLVVLSGDIGAATEVNDNSYHVLVGVNTCTNCIVDRLTIKNGNANGVDENNNGGGIVNHGNLTLKDVVIESNLAADCAGGILNIGALADLTMVGCTLVSNGSGCGSHVLNSDFARIEILGMNIIND